MRRAMELRVRQQLALTPQLQQALRLLQLSALEFTQELEQALSSNPFLEEDPEAPAAASADTAIAATAPDLPAPTPVTPETEAEEAEVRMHDDGMRSPPSSDSDETDWTEWSESPVTLRDHLRNQLLLWQMSDRDRALAHLIIDELNDQGYLETSLEEIASLLSPEQDVEPQELAAALRLVQALEPPGIAARSLQECLLLQLDAMPEHIPGRAVARTIVAQHFSLLANREFTRLQQLVGCDETALHVARSVIRSLDPKPGRRFGPDDTRYVIPDVMVTKNRGKWTATINPAVQPRVRINRAYADLAACRNGSDSSLARQLQEARWLIRNVEQRFATIQRVADAIVNKQRTFFEYGEVAMKPLALKDIAGQLGLHESTVCRVTNGKYMATPRGLFEFKHFFSRQLATENGGACSATAIRALLKELIGAENPDAPLSDAQLARLLAAQGLHVARRTVTKYRTLMRLPSVELRRVAVRPTPPDVR
jgi:RNA polymerase sigma-54 factor